MDLQVSGVEFWIIRVFMWAFYAVLLTRIVGSAVIDTASALRKRWREAQADEAEQDR